MVSPHVNPEIWAKLPRAVRGDDHKLFRVQNLLGTVTHLVVKATDMLLKAKSDPKKLKIDDLVRMNMLTMSLPKEGPKPSNYTFTGIIWSYAYKKSL